MSEPRFDATATVVSAAEETVARYRMFQPDDVVVVGCSGGADSMALLHVLTQSNAAPPLRCIAVYVDHGLRSGTDKERHLVAQAAQGWGADFKWVSVDVKHRRHRRGESIQQAARTLRYAALAQQAKERGARRIAVGHTMTDQAETVLLQLLRGAGPRGLGGIEPVRGEVVRPFLGVTREQTEAYCREHGIHFVDDPSNVDGAYRRSQVRMELLPVLQRLNPAIVPGLARTADILYEEEKWLAPVVSEKVEELAIRRERGGAVDYTLRMDDLVNLPLGLARRVVRTVIARVQREQTGSYGGDGAPDVPGLAFHHIDRVLSFGPSQSGAAAHREIGRFAGVWVVQQYETIVFAAERPRRRGDPLKPTPLQLPGMTLLSDGRRVIEATFAGGDVGPTQGVYHRDEGANTPRGKRDGDAKGVRLGGGQKETATPGIHQAVLRADALKHPVFVRSRRPGDHVTLGGERHVKVKDILMEAKLPLPLRDEVPIVTDADGVVWVAGYALAHRVVAEGEQNEMLVVLTLRDKYD